MIPITCFLFIFFGCISISEVFSAKDCPDAKYHLDDSWGVAVFYCEGEASQDPCELFMKGEKILTVDFRFTAPEDVTDIYYNVSISGDKIDARASGKGDNETMIIGMKKVNSFPKHYRALFGIEAKLEGDVPVGEEGIATVKVYFNENTKDTPDMCVTEKIKIVEEKYEW